MSVPDEYLSCWWTSRVKMKHLQTYCYTFRRRSKAITRYALELTRVDGYWKELIRIKKELMRVSECYSRGNRNVPKIFD